MQTISLEAKTQDGHMKDAFKDLEVLMVRAGEMVSLTIFSLQFLSTQLMDLGQDGSSSEFQADGIGDGRRC